MSALDAIFRECPVAQLRRYEANQPADANVRHLVTFDTRVDPRARDLQEARSLSDVATEVLSRRCGGQSSPPRAIPCRSSYPPSCVRGPKSAARAHFAENASATAAQPRTRSWPASPRD